eukprot:TRINITY_DN12231_c0_g1_i1.p1 TRINITY_DN12231_c0_g1~~TRINITY_DN12231_c0_g1_i1.p1  ORF type:complete len:303 (-),score=56.88 TRINITY_DN12231_c0_g1_i1:465-1373(-)
MGYKQANPKFEDREAESKKVRAKHVGKVPIICQRSDNASERCPAGAKEKFLAQETLTIQKFSAAVRKQLKNMEGELLVSACNGEDVVPLDPGQLVGDVDSEFRDPDGYLYVTYSDTPQPSVTPAPPEKPVAEPPSVVDDLSSVVEDVPAPNFNGLPSQPRNMVTGSEGRRCCLVVSGEEWIWSLTDPHWQFTVDTVVGGRGKPLGSCQKRYSDFQELENAVCAELGEVAWKEMPRLPAAHTVPGIGKLFDTAEVAQQRRVELQEYLQALLQVTGACESQAVRGFCGRDPNDSSVQFVSLSGE